MSTFLFVFIIKTCHNRNERMKSMMQQERHQHILAKLKLEGQVKVKELSQEFHVTEDCIRKDLNILEKNNMLKRIHGGAMPIRQNLHMLNVNERKDVHSKEKQEIAIKAIDLIETGTMVFLGISTINIEIAKLIYQKDMNITLVTNMIDIMNIFRQEGKTKLIFIGGDFNRAKDGFVGPITSEQIQQYRFDAAFLGTVGINVFDGHVTTYDIHDAITKKDCIASSKKCYLVCQLAKLEQDGNYVFGDLSDFTGWICESKPDDHIQRKMEIYGLDII